MAYLLPRTARVVVGPGDADASAPVDRWIPVAAALAAHAARAARPPTL